MACPPLLGMGLILGVVAVTCIFTGHTILVLPLAGLAVMTVVVAVAPPGLAFLQLGRLRAKFDVERQTRRDGDDEADGG